MTVHIIIIYRVISLLLKQVKQLKGTFEIYI